MMSMMILSVKIKASKEKVWSILWNDSACKQWWNVPFSAESYAVSDWKEGSKINFLSPGDSGIYGTIDKIIPYEFMSFKHIGEIKNSKEEPVTEETKKWSGSMENYILEEANDFTELTIEIKSNDPQKYLLEAFPKALEKVKELSEK